jgi:hypothetical protein
MRQIWGGNAPENWLCCMCKPVRPFNKVIRSGSFPENRRVPSWCERFNNRREERPPTCARTTNPVGVDPFCSFGQRFKCIRDIEASACGAPVLAILHTNNSPALPMIAAYPNHGSQVAASLQSGCVGAKGDGGPSNSPSNRAEVRLSGCPSNQGLRVNAKGSKNQAARP